MDKNIRKIKVSVVMPTYKSSKYLKESIISILNQTFKNFELIIINDNKPEDREEYNGTLKIVKSFKDSRVVLIDNKCNIGASKSMNKAIKAAKGEYIARMDSDDISQKTRLKKQLKFLDKNSKYSLVGSWYEIVDEQGEYASGVKLPKGNNHLKIEMFSRNPFSGGGTMFRTNDLKKTGVYEYHDNDYSEDYDLWFRLAALGKIYNLPEYLYKYRIYSNNITNKDKIERQLKAKDRLVKQYRYNVGFMRYYVINRIIQLIKNLRK